VESILTAYQRDGFSAPFRLLSTRECRVLRRHLDSDRAPPPADWHKGQAVTDWPLYRLAASPRLLELLTPILGEDIVLWGCSVVRRRPGEHHPWHVDIESSAASGRCTTVWLGLENSDRNSGLQLIAGSHLLEDTVQQVQREMGFQRGEATAETVLDWARARNPEAWLAEPEVDDGEAILFDRRLWHGSRNGRRRGTRSALLLQYAAADSPVRIHDHAQLEWPFQFVTAPKPPAIVVQGEAKGEANRIVAPPSPSISKRMPMLSTCIRSIELPLRERPGGGWQPHGMFKGITSSIDDMRCHAAVLSPGHSPHPPHSHPEEELLIVLDGEAELLIADEPSYEGARVKRVRRGDFAYYPAFQHHTIRNSGSSPVTYLMFKWHVEAAQPSPNPLPMGFFTFEEAAPNEARGFVTSKLFEGPTHLLGRLQCHASRLEPGAGYAPHVDAHDVAILVLSGRVETLGQEVGPLGVIYHSAGQKHGMRNTGRAPAHYLVFEFQAGALDFRQRLRRRIRPVAKRVLKRTASALGIYPTRP
jgi:quercetin dioxygenase-like cupin family protein